MYRLIDLFAGCGGMTRGFVDTGRFEPVFAVEMDADAAATYAANFPEHNLRAGKIEDVERFPPADVVSVGLHARASARSIGKAWAQSVARCGASTFGR